MRYRDYADRRDLAICGDCSSRTTLALIPRDEIAEHDQWHAAQLMTQAEARQKARELTAAGTPAIATTVPEGAWGGTEQGWTVTYLPPEN